MAIDLDALRKEIQTQAFEVLQKDLEKIKGLTFSKFKARSDWRKFLRGDFTATQLIELVVDDHLIRSSTTRWGLDREALVGIVANSSGIFDRVEKSTPEKGQKTASDFVLEYSLPSGQKVITLASVKNSEGGLNSDSTSGFIVNAYDTAKDLIKSNPVALVDMLLFVLRGTAPAVKKHDLKDDDGEIVKTLEVPVIVGEDAWLFFSGRADMSAILAQIEMDIYDDPAYARLYQEVEDTRSRKIATICRAFERGGFCTEGMINKIRLILAGETPNDNRHRVHSRLRYVMRHSHAFIEGMPVRVDLSRLPSSQQPGSHLKNPTYGGLTETGKCLIRWENGRFYHEKEVDPWFVFPADSVQDEIAISVERALEEQDDDPNLILDLFSDD